MIRSGTFALVIGLSLHTTIGHSSPTIWSDPSHHKERFVFANGVQLQYLDWGGSGPALIFIHDLADNPHMWDDLAPAFTDRFHVIAYARRGHGRSETKGPYDTQTLTEDLKELMDVLDIQKADLVGYSMGGNEITAMAAWHSDRVNRIVYLDAAYDWGDGDFKAAFKAYPSALLEYPLTSMQSMDAYRSYEHAVHYASVQDMGRIEAYLREAVVIQPDGTLKARVTQDLWDSIMASIVSEAPRDYSKVNCPALAIYADTMFDVDVVDAKRRVATIAWERKYMTPFREKSMKRVHREMKGVQVVRVPGAHTDFVLGSRDHVLRAMRLFLGAPEHAG